MGYSSKACGWPTVSISPPRTSGLLPERLLPRRCAACFGMARRTAGPAGATLAVDCRDDLK